VRPGRAADHSPPSSAAVMEEWSYTSTHPLGHTRPVTRSLCLYTLIKTNGNLIKKIPDVPCDSSLVSLVHIVVTVAVFCYIFYFVIYPTAIYFCAYQLESFPNWPFVLLFIPVFE